MAAPLPGKNVATVTSKRADILAPVKHEITDVHLRAALKDARPSVAKEEVQRLARM